MKPPGYKLGQISSTTIKCCLHMYLKLLLLHMSWSFFLHCGIATFTEYSEYSIYSGRHYVLRCCNCSNLDTVQSMQMPMACVYGSSYNVKI